jgi:uncharacterized membrane protein YsdA (DUF1294 family)
MLYLIGWLVIAVLFACLGVYVASQCGRSSGEGFLLGLLFGPVGVIVAALLPRDVSKSTDSIAFLIGLGITIAALAVWVAWDVFLVF